jgi:prepilin-type N-terminal cleavage/methylation domain-containing protein
MQARYFRRRDGGFTLVELMVVVALMTVVAALAIRMMSRASRGERAPAFARSVLAMAHRARQTAIINGRPTRITIYSTGTSSSIVSEMLQPNGTTWQKLDGTDGMEHGVDVCDVQVGRLVTAWPTSGLNCPTTASTSSPTYIYFGKGATACGSNFACVFGNTTTGGATILLQTHDGAKHYRVPIWALTGLPTLVDQ